MSVAEGSEPEVECHVKEKFLECPICNETPSAEVFQCRDGHILCDECMLKVGKVCPQCRVPFGRYKIRCLMLENILNEMVIDCYSKKYGCTEKLKRDDMEVHEDICDFRRVNICQNLGYPECDEYFRNGVRLIRHLKEDHSITRDETTISNKRTFNFKHDEILTNEDKYFLKYIKTQADGIPATFLAIAKIGSDSTENTKICCAVIYLDNRTRYQFGKAERFSSKIDIDIQQGIKETHICTSFGPPLHFKAAEDEKVIPYYSTALDYIKCRLDSDNGPNFELIITVEITCPSTIVNKKIETAPQSNDFQQRRRPVPSNKRPRSLVLTGFQKVIKLDIS